MFNMQLLLLKILQSTGERPNAKTETVLSIKITRNRIVQSFKDCPRTRGQWPLRPAATSARRNRHVMLYDLYYLEIYVHIAYNSHFGGLLGHGGLKMASMASEFKFDLRFEISNLNYPGMDVHVATNSNFGGL